MEERNEDGIDLVELKDNIEELAKHKLNGREIRDVITTARQYARWERQQPNRQHIQLDYKMVKEVIETAGEFDKYVEKLNGGYTYEQIAQEDGFALWRRRVITDRMAHLVQPPTLRNPHWKYRIGTQPGEIRTE